MSRNHRGNRSEIASLFRKQVFLARSFTYQWAFQDRIIRETVCTNTDVEVNEFISENCGAGEPQVFFPDSFLDGVVLYSQLEVAYWDNALVPVPDLKKKAL